MTLTLRNDLLVLRDRAAAILADLDRLLATAAPESDRADLTGLHRTEAIEAVLDRAGRPLRPVEIWRELHESGRRDDPKMVVQSTIHSLWRRGRLVRLGRGAYCHPAHVPS